MSGIVRKALPVDTEGERVSYMIFELPQTDGAPTVPFSERAKQIKAIVARAKSPALKAVHQHPVKDSGGPKAGA